MVSNYKFDHGDQPIVSSELSSSHFWSISKWHFCLVEHRIGLPLARQLPIWLQSPWDNRWSKPKSMFSSKLPQVKAFESHAFHGAIVCSLTHHHHSSNEVFNFVAMEESVVQSWDYVVMLGSCQPALPKKHSRPEPRIVFQGFQLCWKKGLSPQVEGFKWECTCQGTFKGLQVRQLLPCLAAPVKVVFKKHLPAANMPQSKTKGVKWCKIDPGHMQFGSSRKEKFLTLDCLF